MRTPIRRKRGVGGTTVNGTGAHPAVSATPSVTTQRSRRRRLILLMRPPAARGLGSTAEALSLVRPWAFAEPIDPVARMRHRGTPRLGHQHVRSGLLVASPRVAFLCRRKGSD